MTHKSSYKIVALVFASAALCLISFVIAYSVIDYRGGHDGKYFIYSLVFGKHGVNDDSIIEGRKRPHRLGAILRAPEAKIRLNSHVSRSEKLIFIVRFWSTSRLRKRNIYIRINDEGEHHTSVEGHNSYELKIDTRRHIFEQSSQPILSIYTKENGETGAPLPLNIILTSVSVYEERSSRI